MTTGTTNQERFIGFLKRSSSPEDHMADYFSPVIFNITNDSIIIEDTSLDDYEDYYMPYHLRPETYIVPVLFVLIFIIGAVGNGTLIYIFMRNKNLRNVPNTYVISLSIGDLLVIVITVPFVSTVFTFESWPYGEVICKFSEFVRDISIGVSVFTLTALSADRYFAIVNPMRRHMGRRAGRVTVMVAVGIWIVSIFLSLPAVVFSYVQSYRLPQGNKTILVCDPFPQYLGEAYPKINVMVKFLVYYAVPLIIITFFYTIMARHLLLSSSKMLGENQQQQQRQVDKRKKVAKMVLSFVIMFAICFFPNHVFLLWFYFDLHARDVYDDYWNAFRIVGFCLSFINSCINPITLYCVSRLFRKYYNHYLFCCTLPSRHRRNPPVLDTNSTALSNLNSMMRRPSTSVSVLQTAAV